MLKGAFYITTLLLLMASETHAQFSMPSTVAAGIVIRSNGMGVQYNRTYDQMGKFSWIGGVELVNQRHPAEMRILSADNFDPGTFSYGKLHHAGLLRFLAGKALSLNERVDQQNPEIFVNFQGGIQLAALKPVYLRVINYSGPGDGFVQYERFNADLPTPKSDILGEAPFSEGLNETRFKAGLHLRSSILLQWTNQSGGTRNIEVGAQLDYFNNGLPLMAQQENPSISPSFFMSFTIGKNNRHIQPSFIY